MIDPKLLRSAGTEVARNLARRGFALDVGALQALEERRRHWQIEVDRLRAARNSHAKAVGQARGRGEDIAPLVLEGERLTAGLAAADAELAARAGGSSSGSRWSCRTCCTSRCRTGAMRAPMSRSRGTASRVASTSRPRDHVAIGEALGQLDFEAAARMSGARFVVMRGALARLQRALAQFMLDLHTREHGYTEVYAPYLVGPQALTGTGQLPKFETELFALRGEHGPVPDPDRRGSADQPGARADPRGRRAAAQVRRAHAVLPLRGRRRRTRHARHHPPAPVRQGRAGADRASGRFLRGARSAAPPRRDRTRAPGAALPHAGAVRRGRRLRRAPRPTTSRSGCPRSSATARSPRAATARPSRRGACRRDGAIPPAANPNRCIR